jgi:hypothetical protein
MRIRQDRSFGKTNPPTGYTIWLSADDTERWAGERWPCSELAGNRLVACVDANGLCDLAVNGQDADPDNTELEAMVSDHLPKPLRHLWPTYE